ncbi:ammonium transporter [Poriferisphaera sp. WC338]|uniref:ammonium transporter n=1 Tax=Poriferisphaera sp. WC338 TaxID=3425129 RepID=UPI003D81356F
MMLVLRMMCVMTALLAAEYLYGQSVNDDVVSNREVTGQVVTQAIATVADSSGASSGPVIDTGTTAWMLVSTALVLLMVPGLALFYGGLVRTKNVLGTMMHSFVAMGIIGVSWAVVGYALCFGKSVGGIIGWDPSYLMLSGLDSGPGAFYMIDEKSGLAIPALVFAMFQGKFAIITPALIAGAFAERVKFGAYCLFVLFWSLLVYSPLCHWIWGGGFLYGKAIDFAGGTVIHISAGAAGLVAALYFGARKGYPKTAMHPNNLVMTLLGAGLLWVGWFGFNAGSSIESGLTTARALTVTQIAAATGALTWILIESLHLRKATSLGLVSGILAGLVAITPAAGDVPPYGAIVLGILGAAVSYGAIVIKSKLGYDDTLDVFGIHGIAGIVGAICLTFVMREIPEHGLGMQLYYQIEGVFISLVYAAIMTLGIVVVLDKTIGFRMCERQESEGMDHVLHGEHGYGLLNLN